MPSSEIYYDFVLTLEGAPLRNPAGEVWLAAAGLAYWRFKELDKPVEDHLEGEYYFDEDDVHYWANLINRATRTEGRLDIRWISKCNADSPYARYNYLRETSYGQLRLTVPGECGGVRELPDDLLAQDRVVLRDTDDNNSEVTYGELLDWVQNTYPRLVNAHPLKEYLASQEQTQESEQVVSNRPEKFRVIREGLCLLGPICKKQATTRGLCNAHYSLALLRVQKGITTWEELVELGMALGPRPYRGTQRATFEELHEWFSSDLTFKEIGEMLRLSTQRVQQIYAKHFADIVPNKPSGMLRRNLRATKRSLVKSYNLEGLNDKARQVAELLRSDFGYQVRKVTTSVLSVNNHICRVRYASTSHKGSRNREYFTFSRKSPYESPEFLIALCGNGNKFVFPVEVIQTVSNLNIPLVKLPAYNNRYPKVDWWKYKDAWELLR